MIDLITGRPKPDSATLLQRAERAIQERQLPRGITSRVWGGRGSGMPCSLCGQPIDSNDVEIELDGVDAASGVRFHSHCHLLWQQACKRVGEANDH